MYLINRPTSLILKESISSFGNIRLVRMFLYMSTIHMEASAFRSLLLSEIGGLMLQGA